MEETNNVEETVIETPKVEETPVTESAPVEEVAVVEEPKVEEPEMNRGPHGTMTEEAQAKSEASEVIGAPRYAGGSDTVQTVGVTNNGAIGTANVDRPVKKAAAPKKAKSEDTVAILSTRNVTWNGVGKVYRGYNIVSKEAAEKWLTRDHCRIATPEEVAKGFGK